MQIMPTNRNDTIFDFASARDGGGFFDAMQDAMSAVENGENFNVDSALADEPVVEAPYSRQSTDGVTYTLAEVCFTKAELAELREQLLKEGAPLESLGKFDILASQPDGATLAQVMASLMSNGTAGKFTENDVHAITAMLGQIDPSGTLAEDALAFMSQGNGQAALELIRNAVAKMPADQSIEVDPASLVSLGKALGLNQDTMNQMANMLGGHTLRLNGDQFTALMEPASSQFMTDAANYEKLQAALDKTLKPIIAKARDRMEKELEATQRESRRVQQSRILIDQTVQRNSRETLDQTVSGQGSFEAGKASGMVGKAGADRANAAQTRMAGEAQSKLPEQAEPLVGSEFAKMPEEKEGLIETKPFMNAKAQAKAAELTAQASEEKNSSFSGGDKEQSGDAWQDLFGKMETRAAATLSPTTGNSSVVYSMLQGSLENQLLNAEQQLNHTLASQLNQQLADQVERGLLTVMKDGGTRMDLQLHPAELGTLSITLIARNGEVTAQLKSERTETAELLTRQLDMIRVNLEEQGVKVDKIEVQLENRQDSQFADLGGHNAWQEESSRRQEMARMRNLANLRGGQDDDSSLARGLHNTGQSARYAGQALHVVA